MAYIGKTPTVGNFQVCDAISVVNGQAAYTLQVGGVNVAPESANHMLVSLNGILQKPGSSFTISGSTMTFASNLATGDVIDFVTLLGNVLDIGQPSDDTVTAAKLNDNVISGQTALAATPADTDELLISDAGTIKRIDYSHIKTAKTWTRVAANVLTSDASSMSTDDAFTTTHTHYKLIGNFGVTTSGAELNMQFRAGGSDITASNYYYALRLIDHDGGNHDIVSTNATTFGRVWNDVYHNDDEWDGGVGIDMSIFNVKKKDTLNGSDVTPGTAARPHVILHGSGYNTGNSKYSGGYGMIRYNADLAHGSNADGLKFLPSTGNIMAGSYYIIYGLEDE